MQNTKKYENKKVDRPEVLPFEWERRLWGEETK